MSALSEAKRVARPGGTVALTTFGRPERCDSTRFFAAMRELAEAGQVVPQEEVRYLIATA